MFLDISPCLGDFFAIKSKKIEILNEKFSISNLLNDVSASIEKQVTRIRTDETSQVRAVTKAVKEAETLESSDCEYVSEAV